MNRHHYRGGSFFWLALGVFTAAGAYRLGLGRFREPGPGFIFFLAGLLLASLSVVDILLSFMSGPDQDEEEKPLWSGLRWRKVLGVTIAISIYIYALHYLGFLVSTFLLMVFLFKAVEPMKWWIALLGSSCTILISYGLFNLWLNVPFPTGFLGF